MTGVCPDFKGGKVYRSRNDRYSPPNKAKKSVEDTDTLCHKSGKVTARHIVHLILSADIRREGPG